MDERETVDTGTLKTAAEAPKGIPHVVIRNSCRRPLLFRGPRGTVRLSPGEHVELPKAWLGSIELRRMVESGLVSSAPAEEKEHVPDAPPDSGDETGPKASSPGPAVEAVDSSPAEPVVKAATTPVAEQAPAAAERPTPERIPAGRPVVPPTKEAK